VGDKKMLHSDAITKTKDVLIAYLRQFLTNRDNYKDFCNADYSNAEIFDKEPTALRSFPSILITSINGNYVNSGLSDMAQELYDDDGTCIGYRYSGMFELPITIELATRSTPDRDRLADLISMTIRVLMRRQLELQGILIKDMRYAGESEILYDSDKVYIATLQFTTWSEWYKDVNFLPLTGIDVNGELDNKNL
jgi:hypothetical protein